MVADPLSATYPLEARASSQLWIAVGGSFASLGMLLGALGPWAATPSLTFSGWAGIGLPLAFVAVGALLAIGVYALTMNRGWLILSGLCAGVCLLAAIAVFALVAQAAHFAEQLALVLKRDESAGLIDGDSISSAWGVWLLLLSSGALSLLSAVGLFVRPTTHRKLTAAAEIDAGLGARAVGSRLGSLPVQGLPLPPCSTADDLN